MTWLALAGAVASVIGAFYYLRIVFYMYFGKETDGVESRMDPIAWVALMAASAMMLLGIVNLFGIEPAAAIAAEALVR
jgi:NADH-quinone oxidoreductase subunit N